tara:strand:+ start:3265 stop:4311 length:1047 start_codon:yes stop_codon:yes gene_type:complete
MKKKLIYLHLFFIFNLFFSNSLIIPRILSEEKQGDFNNLDINYNSESYILGPGDKIQLQFASAVQFNGVFRILNDGTLTLPIIGRRYVENLDLTQLERFLYREYSDKLLNPDLTINLYSSRAIKVSVVGEIMKPGLYAFESNDDALPTVISSLIQAGGITRDANLKNVKLIRKLPGMKGEKKVATINLADFIINGDQSQNLKVFDGDVIILDKAKNLENSELLATSNIYSQVINVNVIGQVKSPGSKVIPANSSLLEAIMSAGGPIKWKTNRGNIELFRINDDGTAIKKRFKLDLAKGVSQKANPILKNGDLVRVNPTLLNNVTTGLGAATEPLSSVLNALALIKLIN